MNERARVLGDLNHLAMDGSVSCTGHAGRPARYVCTRCGTLLCQSCVRLSRVPRCTKCRAEAESLGPSVTHRIRHAQSEAPCLPPDPRAHPAVFVVSHFVTPLAIVAMVASILFYFAEVRSVFLPGRKVLEQVGLCFVVATVLIVRYGETDGDRSRQLLYTIALWVATLLFLSCASLADELGTTSGFLAGLLILAVVWTFTAYVTRGLSLERIRLNSGSSDLSGLLRTRVASWSPGAPGEEVTESGNHLSCRNEPLHALGQVRAWVLRLAAVVMVGFAVAEPVLLGGSSYTVARALGSMIVFMFATTTVLASATSNERLFKTQRARGRISPRLVLSRVLIGTLLSTIAVAVGLALFPLKVTSGGGWRILEHGMSQHRGSQDRSLDDEESPEQRIADGKSANAAEVAGAQIVGPGAHGSLGSVSVVDVMSALGRILLAPLVLVLFLLLCYALLQIGPSARAWRRAFERRMRAAVLGTLDWLRSLRARKTKRPDHQMDLRYENPSSLRDLSPNDAVVAAYCHLLSVMRASGHPRLASQTPIDYLRSLPRLLHPIAGPLEKLTSLYVRAGYAAETLTSEHRESAIQAALEARRRVFELSARRQ